MKRNLYRIYYYGFAVDVEEEEMVKTVELFTKYGHGPIKHLIIDWIGTVENGEGVYCTETAADILSSIKEVRDKTKQ